MKIVSLLAGVAAVALTAGVASAQDINRGQFTLGPLPIIGTQHIDVGGPGAGNLIAGLANNATAQNGNSSISAWHAFGNAASDVGTAANNDSATFTIQGTISTDCAYYSGDNTTETFNFGTIGIYASDNTGPNSAFEMVDDAELTINTNLAGCNSNNSVTISRTSADLQNPNTSGFDNTVFRDTLPYSVTARYTGSDFNTGVGGAPVARTQTLAAGAAGSSVQQNGAWRSPMALDVVIPQQPLAILAGTYSGSFSITLQTI